ncbi:MAG: YsnF/AvaK domain-containing protein [Alphaproteobacteria bacterium]|nr:YsnF/AvaK domain-containing protein [Alphaproteobacteria bacterium]
MTNVIGLYDDPEKAKQAMDALMEAGLMEEDVELLAEADDDIERYIGEMGIARREAHLYAEAVRRGKAVVSAATGEEQIDEILDILDRNGAIDLDEVAKELGLSEEEEGGEEAEGAEIPLVEEEMSVGKRRMRASKRVTTEVVEQPVEATVDLEEEKLEVSETESDRELSPEEAEAAFKDETLDFEETREVPEVTKQARQTGKVKVSKGSTTRQEKVGGTVRKTEVRTEDLDKK